MTIVEEIAKNLVDSEKHGSILQALIAILEEDGEKGLKDRIRKWVQEIQDESPAGEESEQV